MELESEIYFDTLIVQVRKSIFALLPSALKFLAQVEGRLSKVPRAVFARSSVFQDMFTLPQNKGTVTDGSDNEHPLVLEGVKLVAFKPFVRVAIASEYVDRASLDYL
jgi:hypothetical protein